MLVTCKSFHCEPDPQGGLKLYLDEGTIIREDKLMTREEVASYLQKHPRTISRYTTRKRRPLPCVFSGDGYPRFRRDEVDKWLAGVTTRKRKPMKII